MLELINKALLLNTLNMRWVLRMSHRTKRGNPLILKSFEVAMARLKVNTTNFNFILTQVCETALLGKVQNIPASSH
jgi:hypothetical protein